MLGKLSLAPHKHLCKESGTWRQISKLSSQEETQTQMHFLKKESTYIFNVTGKFNTRGVQALEIGRYEIVAMT